MFLSCLYYPQHAVQSGLACANMRKSAVKIRYTLSFDRLIKLVGLLISNPLSIYFSQASDLQLQTFFSHSCHSLVEYNLINLCAWRNIVAKTSMFATSEDTQSYHNMYFQPQTYMFCFMPRSYLVNSAFAQVQRIF